MSLELADAQGHHSLYFSRLFLPCAVGSGISEYILNAKGVGYHFSIEPMVYQRLAYHIRHRKLRTSGHNQYSRCDEVNSYPANAVCELTYATARGFALRHTATTT